MPDSIIRNAFVLGAGLGTRLRPLTNLLPKPLIPVCNKPLICHAFDHLLEAGIERIVVNTHHCAGEYAKAFPCSTYRGRPLHFRHEPDLLETGGGIRNVEDLLGDAPFIVYNGDILTDLPLAPIIRHHFEAGNEVTLALRSSGGPLQVSMDPETGRVTDIGSRLHPGRPGAFLFTGVYVVNSAFLRRIPPRQKVSVIPAFIEMIRTGAPLGGVVVDAGAWRDLGNREAYLEAHRALSHTPGFGPGPWIHPEARVAATARIDASSAIGAGAVVGENAELTSCILWPGAGIADGARLTNCIVTPGAVAGATHDGRDFLP